MTDTVTIRRELLEAIVNTNVADYEVIYQQKKELRAALAAPVQGVNTQLLEALEAGPEYGDGPEFEGWPERSGQQPINVGDLTPQQRLELARGDKAAPVGEREAYEAWKLTMKPYGFDGFDAYQAGAAYQRQCRFYEEPKEPRHD